MAGNKKVRKAPSKDYQRIAPMLTLVGKQKVGNEDADAVALPLLIHFDAAKRGQGPAVGQQHLYKHLIMAQLLAAWTKSQVMYDATVKACDALMKASQRPTELLDLSTSEYTAMRKAYGMYLRILPIVEVAMYGRAGDEAERLMGNISNQGAA